MSEKIECCEELEKAKESGTDNEGYGRLVREIGGEFKIGCDLEPIKYCPWCGKYLG